MNKLNFVKIGKKETGMDVINVIERVRCFGVQKAKGLIGLHNLSGADWGGKLQSYNRSVAATWDIESRYRRHR